MDKHRDFSYPVLLLKLILCKLILPKLILLPTIYIRDQMIINTIFTLSVKKILCSSNKPMPMLY